MAPKRKAVSETSSLKTIKQQRRTSQRVIGMTTNNSTNTSVILKQKQSQSKRWRMRKDDDGENELAVIEQSTSNKERKSIISNSDDVDSGDQELSTSDSYLNISNTNEQVKPSSCVQIDIGDDEDDTDEFEAMFMSNVPLSKRSSGFSSTPLVRSRQDKPFPRTTTEFISSNQIKKPTHRHPLSTITVDHQSTTSNLNMQNLNTPNNPRISTNSSPSTQVSVGNQSLSSINYKTSNSAILETYTEYRTLRRDLQQALQKIETWRADYKTLTRQMERLKNDTFPRPNADGRLFLEQLLQSLTSCEQDEDNRTSKDLATAIGIRETTLLSCSNVDPQKTALHVFNYRFPSNADKEKLVNVTTLNVEYPNLLKDILVWSKRCTPGCSYSMVLLKEAIGNSIRCARHKLKMDQVRLIVATTGSQFEKTNLDDGVERMSQDDY